MYKGDADWTLIAAIKNNPRIRIPIFGNGDVDSPQKALEYRNKFGVDGIMIGRASIGAPWVFREIKHFFETGEVLPSPDVAERVQVCRAHFNFSIRWKGDRLGIFEMRRHYASYFKGLHDFKPYRSRLVETEKENEVHAILDEINDVFSCQPAFV